MKELGNNSFEEVIQIIETSRSNAYQKVNEELILMYQRIGKYLSDHSQNTSYGDSYIDSLSKHIQERFPGIKGFTRREELTNLLLSSGCSQVIWKFPEESGFYQPIVIARK